MTPATHRAAQEIIADAGTIPPSDLQGLADHLVELRAQMLALEGRHAATIAAVTESHRASARNLVHYLAMRRQDLRPLQTGLALVGLSSIGRSEAHALWSVEAVLGLLGRLAGIDPGRGNAAPPCDLRTGAALLDSHTRDLLGPEPAERSARIMVTMSTDAATDYTLVRRLLESGMDCMRINCAHDGPAEWRGMIENLRQARASVGRPCRVLMDLAGPKLRTGPVEPGPAALKLRPSRDALGQVCGPARVWLTSSRSPAAPPSHADGILHVDEEWLAQMDAPRAIRFRDTRGRRREMTAVHRDLRGLWCELERTAYLADGIDLVAVAEGGEDDEPSATTVSGVPSAAGAIRVFPADLLLLTRDPLPGRPASFDSAGRLLSPARVSFTLPDVFADVRVGHRVCIDDGRMVGVAEAVTPDEIRVRVQRTPSRGAKLMGDKGINFPDSDLRLPALTDKDLQDLEFVVRHADIVGLSFANHESDVIALIEQFRRFSDAHPGILLKIETRRGFERLPAMLLTAMRTHSVGVMIARGDLAVECGYERLAEAQEEILWICEAAHCPAVWATQVLETLAREGIPSRAEISDAAMGHRAECVMLNKGPHIQEAVSVLDDILRRMDAHQSKKRAMLRALRLATEFDRPAG